MTAAWSIDSWRSKPAAQQVEYENPVELAAVLDLVRQFPPIVTSWEIRNLRQQLAEVSRGERFLLQGGDCSERFGDCQSNLIDAKLKILLKMGLVLVHAGGKPVVRVGRIAGQYAKPRSSDTETRDGVTLPSYRGDLVNRPEFDPESRRPDPQNLLRGYTTSAMTINFIRSLLTGGFGDVHNPQAWDLSFMADSDHSKEYRRIVRHIGDALRFLETMVRRPLEELKSPDFFTSHEGLHLEYETAVSEVPPLRTGWYNLGTHMPWIGDRTRALDGAHVEYFRGIENPVGVKVGPSMDPKELVEICQVLNPNNETGRIVFIHRLGADRVRELLPPLVEAVLRQKLSVVWCNDPMHGNTYKAANGFKTRNFDRILAEIRESFSVHEELGSIQGGVHFEMTGENVTECIGGARGLTESDLPRDYRSEVDPRLNDEQALEMAFLIATRMQQR